MADSNQTILLKWLDSFIIVPPAVMYGRKLFSLYYIICCVCTVMYSRAVDNCYIIYFSELGVCTVNCF